MFYVHCKKKNNVGCYLNMLLSFMILMHRKKGGKFSNSNDSKTNIQVKLRFCYLQSSKLTGGKSTILREKKRKENKNTTPKREQ